MFHDFELRAWLVDATQAQVLVHCSPVGDMREPVCVPFDLVQMESFRAIFADRWVGQPQIDWAQLVEGGRQLAAILLPPPVYTLLNRSLERIPEDDGLRIRLCLDRVLIDLPWEYLYRPDAAGQDAKAFLALDARISLVRETPRLLHQVQPTKRRQRLLFAGTPFHVQGTDLWQVEQECQQLLAALEPVQELLLVQTLSAPQSSFERGLVGAQVDIFHYAGHADIINGKGVVLEEIRTDPIRDTKYTIWKNDEYRGPYGVDRLYVDLLESEKLAQLLRRAGVSLTVFSACNSGRLAFVEPFIQEGIPVFIGTQGYTAVNASIAFCRTLYSALATGLSFDEAITWSRLHLLEPGVLPVDEQWYWGMFMVYMLAQDATLFAKPKQGQAGKRQSVAREERAKTIIKVYGQYVENQAVVDQRGQTVQGEQINIEGGVEASNGVANIAAIPLAVDARSELRSLLTMVARASTTGVLDEEQMIDVEGALRKAAAHAERGQWNADLIIDHLIKAQTIMAKVAAGHELITAIEKLLGMLGRHGLDE